MELRRVRTMLVLQGLSLLGCQLVAKDPEIVVKSKASCFLNMPLSGEIEEELIWGIKHGCGLGTGSSTEKVEVSFGILVTDFTVQLQFDEMVEGEKGADFPTKIRIIHKDARKWSSDWESCRVTVLDHKFESEDETSTYYIFTVAGGCPDGVLEPEAGHSSGNIEVGSFSLSTRLAWPKI